MDLSGTDHFRRDDTIEVEGLTTGRDRILTAGPMRQVLTEGNVQGRLALRARRGANDALSNVVHLLVEDIAVLAALAGYQNFLLETMLKLISTGVGDPLLEAEAASIQPATGNEVDLHTRTWRLRSRRAGACPARKLCSEFGDNVSGRRRADSPGFGGCRHWAPGGGRRAAGDYVARFGKGPQVVRICNRCARRVVANLRQRCRGNPT